MHITNNLYHFNATCEMAVGNGTNSFTPPAYLQQFEQELELLPIYLANESDYLLVNKVPSACFLEQLSLLKADIPTINTYEGLISEFKQGRNLNAIKPWGWSPMEHKYLDFFKSYCSIEFNKQPNANWQAEHKQLYSRNTALQVLKSFLNKSNERSLFIDEEDMPKKLGDILSIENALKKCHNLVVKAPWSASGRGIIVLKNGLMHKTYVQWINGVLKNQGYVMCEPLFNKVFDLSFHFNITNDDIEYLGQASFATDDREQYIGNFIQALPPNLTLEEQVFLSESNLNLIAKGLAESLKQSDIFKQYTGVLGVDVLVYRDNLGKLKFNPCMEINLRQNMGTMALKIRELLHVEAKGMWRVKRFEKPTVNAALEFDEFMQKKHQLLIEDDKVMKGYLPMIEPYEERSYALYLEVD